MSDQAKIHSKKLLAEYFQQILDGKKTFEVRLADWECNAGDTLTLVEIDSRQHETGRRLTCKVGTVSHTKNMDHYTSEQVEQYGYQVLSLLEPEAVK